jgi:hypothetical protein
MPLDGVLCIGPGLPERATQHSKNENGAVIALDKMPNQANDDMISPRPIA